MNSSAGPRSGPRPVFPAPELQSLMRPDAPDSASWGAQVPPWRLEATGISPSMFYAYDWVDPVAWDTWLYRNYGRRRSTLDGRTPPSKTLRESVGHVCLVQAPGQYLADELAREPGSVELLNEPDALDGVVEVLPLPAVGPGGGQQLLLLVVAQCPDAHPCLFGDFSDPHGP